MNEKAIKYLYGLLKDTRIALGNAERKTNVDPVELDNLRSKIDMLEYSAAAVLAYEEPKHGEWIYDTYGDLAKCSRCGVLRNVYRQEGWNFCPNCGAKMDGGKD